MSFLPEDIDRQLREEIERRGLVLLELGRRGQLNTTVIEVIVDSEKGVSLDEITDLSRWISSLFDEAAEAIPGRYRLEVSSAGLDRPLEYEWQFRKNVGRLVKLTFDDDGGTRKTDVFRLLELGDSTLTVGPKAKNAKPGQGILVIPVERVKRALVEPEF
jgi:ribosome maturation factor RimP